jgi:hypothetical protein
MATLRKLLTAIGYDILIRKHLIGKQVSYC